jgi:hypothetical protein
MAPTFFRWARHHQVLGHVDLALLIVFAVREQLDLGDGLVGRRAHHEAQVAGTAAGFSGGLGQQDGAAVREDPWSTWA